MMLFLILSASFLPVFLRVLRVRKSVSLEKTSLHLSLGIIILLTALGLRFLLELSASSLSALFFVPPRSSSLFYSFLVVSLSEELAKGAGIRFFFREASPRETVEGALTAGLSFGAVENILYALSFPGSSFFLIFIRTFTALLFHAGSFVIFAYFRKSRSGFFKSLILLVLFHGFYNRNIGSHFFWIFLINGILGIYAFLLYRVVQSEESLLRNDS